MTTRKPKPTFESMIELPTLQLATVSVEQKTPARATQGRHPTELRPATSLTRHGKITLH